MFFLYVVMSILFCYQIFLVAFGNVHSCFTRDSSCDLMLILWLWVVLRMCHALLSCYFLSFPWPAPMCEVESVLPARMSV
jgi:hypothetical protein